MTRDFSSGQTLIYKLVYPSVWAALSGSFAVLLYLHPEQMAYNGVMGAAPWWFVYVWSAIALGGTVFILLYFWRFKYVGIEDGALVVSNYWTDWRVPFSLIEDVRQTRFTDPPHITITLKEDVGCGREVIFMPKQLPTLSVSAFGFGFSRTMANTQLAESREAVGLASS